MKKILALVITATAAGGSILTGLVTEHARAQDGAPIRTVDIVVDGGYRPDRIPVRQGERVRLRFIRREHSGCTREVVFPWLDLRRELPPNQPVVIDLPAMRAGEYEFRCGMNMVRGTVVVEPE